MNRLRRSPFPRNVLRSLVCMLLATSGAFAATLTLTPNVISNDYAGAVSFDIGGLTNGEAVLVERFYDVNGNGAPDAGEFTLQSFRLKDGQASVIGGVTNLHVPGDLGSVSGAITAQLQMKSSGFEQKFIGKHVYRLSSPSGRFSPILVPFTVTNTAYSAQVSGNVVSSGTNVPYAAVVLFGPNGENVEPRIGTAADATGHFSLKAPPGTYLLLSFRGGYACDFSTAPMLTIADGASLSADIPLLPASRLISGRIVDAADNSRGLGGLLTPAESQDGKLAVGFTDASGNLAIPATPGLWKVGPDDSGLNLLGYVAVQQRQAVDCTAGDVTSLLIPMQKGTALFYGTVKTDTATPLPGVRLYGNESTHQYETSPSTDQYGRYFMPVSPGSWDTSVDTGDPSLAGYIFSRAPGSTAVQSGQAIQWDFTAKLAPYTLSGYIKDGANNPVSGVDVYVWGNIGGVDYSASALVTDAQGFFSTRVANGQWFAQPACEGDNGLAIRKFHCLNFASVTVANANATQSFTVQSCGGLAVTTATLPQGQVGSYYSQQLQADGCGFTFFWGLAPGSGPLPNGLQILSNGALEGTPTQTGTFNFTVRVMDGLNTADRPLTLTVGGAPLTISTYGLPEATNGVSYSLQLAANGGRPPYAWSLAPGSASLPAGLTLSPAGLISGVPTSIGTAFFFIRATDADSAIAERGFSLTVRGPELVVTTTALPDGTAGQPYSAQLQATGGQPPYLWSLALGSANLPAGLGLAASGQVSGTPAVSGTFNFRVLIQDSGFMSATQSVSIKLNAAALPPTLSAAQRLSDGRFSFIINGTTGAKYSLQLSTDLQNWSTLQVTNAPSASFPVVDVPRNEPKVYYRILVGP